MKLNFAQLFPFAGAIFYASVNEEVTQNHLPMKTKYTIENTSIFRETTKKFIKIYHYIYYCYTLI